MSKTRNSGSTRLSVIKERGCRFCNNDKMHSSGLWLKCTKCKNKQ